MGNIRRYEASIRRTAARQLLLASQNQSSSPIAGEAILEPWSCSMSFTSVQSPRALFLKNAGKRSERGFNYGYWSLQISLGINREKNICWRVGELLIMSCQLWSTLRAARRLRSGSQPRTRLEWLGCCEKHRESSLLLRNLKLEGIKVCIRHKMS